MKIKKYFMLFCLTYSFSNHVIANPQIITLFCPAAEDILVNPQSGSWAKYKYTAYTKIDIPEIGNQLEMIGEGDIEKITVFQAATWTDRTFLCNYNSFSWDAVVIFETKLDDYVKECHFNNTPHRSECNSTNTFLCPMICELGKEED